MDLSFLDSSYKTEIILSKGSSVGGIGWVRVAVGACGCMWAWRGCMSVDESTCAVHLMGSYRIDGYGNRKRTHALTHMYTDIHTPAHQHLHTYPHPSSASIAHHPSPSPPLHASPTRRRMVFLPSLLIYCDEHTTDHIGISVLAKDKFLNCCPLTAGCCQMATSLSFIVLICWIIHLSGAINNRSRNKNCPPIVSKIEYSDTREKDFFLTDALLGHFSGTYPSSQWKPLF